jgi:hypothetical protein
MDAENTTNFMQSVEQGKLYEDLSDDVVSRDEIKKKLFSQVFFPELDRPPSAGWIGGGVLGKARKRFEEKYPEVLQVIKELQKPGAIKSFGGFDVGNLEHDRPYRGSALVLQRTESKFMDELVLPIWIRKMGLGRFVQKIHDCLVVFECDLNVAKACIDEAAGLLGLQLTVSTEVWKKDNRGRKPKVKPTKRDLLYHLAGEGALFEEIKTQSQIAIGQGIASIFYRSQEQLKSLRSIEALRQSSIDDIVAYSNGTNKVA